MDYNSFIIFKHFQEFSIMKAKILLLIFALFFLSFTVTNNSYSEPRRVLLEFCTGTWCQWCPCGDWAAEQILTTYPGTMVLAYHGPQGYGDPFATFNGNNILGLMGFSAYPTGVIDRGNSPSNPYVDYTMWMSYVQQRYNSSPTSPVNITITAKNYNSSTRQLTATVDATALENLSGQYKISYVVTESNVMDTLHPQVNNNVCDTGSVYFIHKWIVRNMVNNAGGENLNSGAWNLNQTITKNVTTTLDAGWVATNCTLNIFVFKDSTTLCYSRVQQTLMQAVTQPLGISNPGNEIPSEYSLSQNYPNPFNPTTHVKFALPKDGNVSLKVYDMLGNEVAVYVNGFLKAGTYNADIDGSNWASGVYFYRLTTPEYTAAKKMMLVK
jgi:hypothetical protein